MLDKIQSRPTGPSKLYPNVAAFAVIRVAPFRDAGRKPLMPLLSRGDILDDEHGESWTVLRAHVKCMPSEFSGDELPYYYAYEYEAVNGRRRLN